MVSPNSLKSVESAFNQWRETRISRRESVPGELRQQAVELLSHHKQSQILNTLNINHAMLKQWQQESAIPSAMFVTLPNEHSATESKSFQVTLYHLGSEMHISGNLTPTDLCTLAQSFIASQGAGHDITQ